MNTLRSVSITWGPVSLVPCSLPPEPLHRKPRQPANAQDVVASATVDTGGLGHYLHYIVRLSVRPISSHLHMHSVPWVPSLCTPCPAGPLRQVPTGHQTMPAMLPGVGTRDQWQVRGCSGQVHSWQPVCGPPPPTPRASCVQLRGVHVLYSMSLSGKVTLAALSHQSALQSLSVQAQVPQSRRLHIT